MKLNKKLFKNFEKAELIKEVTNLKLAFQLLTNIEENYRGEVERWQYRNLTYKSSPTALYSFSFINDFIYNGDIGISKGIIHINGSASIKIVLPYEVIEKKYNSIEEIYYKIQKSNYSAIANKLFLKTEITNSILRKSLTRVK